MIAVPVLTAATIPLEDPTVATPALPLVHEPPAGVELSVVVPPGHKATIPEIGVGLA